VHDLTKKGSIIVSLCRKLGEPASITPLGGEGPRIPDSADDGHVVAVVQEVSHPATGFGPHVSNSSKSPEQAPDSVSSAIEHAKVTTERLKGYGGTTIDNVTAVTSSDLCGTLLGYVDKVVQLGDIVSKVPLSYALCTSFYSLITARLHFRSTHMRNWRGTS